MNAYHDLAFSPSLTSIKTHMNPSITEKDYREHLLNELTNNSIQTNSGFNNDALSGYKGFLQRTADEEL